MIRTEAELHAMQRRDMEIIRRGDARQHDRIQRRIGDVLMGFALDEIRGLSNRAAARKLNKSVEAINRMRRRDSLKDMFVRVSLKPPR